VAYLAEFTIYGLAGRSPPVHRVLDRHVNVFWGLNGTGKTSLLKILNSALTNQVSILRRVPFERAEVLFWSGDGQVKIMRTIVHESIDFEESADPFEDSGSQAT